jgi:hypothetical protein
MTIVRAAILCAFALGAVAAVAAEPKEELRVFAGAQLVLLREKVNGQKFTDMVLHRALVDKLKSAHAVLFKVKYKDDAIESVEFMSVATGQIIPQLVKTIKPTHKDYDKIKKHLKLTD